MTFFLFLYGQEIFENEQQTHDLIKSVMELSLEPLVLSYLVCVMLQGREGGCEVLVIVMEE